MQSLRIRELPAPITAAKADWLAGTNWLGFTPVGDSHNARNDCMSSINRQFGQGYVLEYITLKFGDVNSGYETDPRFLSEKASHKENAGRFIAVHRLRASGRPLVDILGKAEYEDLQNRWAVDGERYRWSVSFPIVESFSITGKPFASSVFDAEAMQRVFAHPSRTLRPLIDREYSLLLDLEIEPRTSQNSWIAIEDEIAIADRPENTFSKNLAREISKDIPDAALEGLTDEQRQKIRKRAVWLANKFLQERTKFNRFTCDDCGFDPLSKIQGTNVRPRSLMDVHHKDPLAEGIRYTTVMDFALLCPNCHRYTHAEMRSKIKNPLG